MRISEYKREMRKAFWQKVLGIFLIVLGIAITVTTLMWRFIPNG